MFNVFKNYSSCRSVTLKRLGQTNTEKSEVDSLEPPPIFFRHTEKSEVDSLEPPPIFFRHTEKSEVDSLEPQPIFFRHTHLCSIYLVSLTIISLVNLSMPPSWFSILYFSCEIT